LRQFYLRLVGIVFFFVAVATLFALHARLAGQP